MNDKQLKEQIDALNTLSAGIVYGKEQAWDKLQERMDKKPARRLISMPYRIAVIAAMLLLSAGIALHFYTTIPTNAGPFYTVTYKRPAANNVIIVDKQADKLEKSTVVLTATRQSSHTNLKKNKDVIVTLPIPVTQPLMPAAQPREMVLPTAIVTIAPMIIVHLNDLHNKSILQRPLPAGTAIATNSYAIPVMHINDVIHAEQEEHKILKENRLSINPISLFNSPPDTEPEDNVSTRPFYPHPLQIKLNSQN